MEVILSAPRGFCAGVVRAIEVVEICLERYGAPVYVKHQIVHNPYVVTELERKGAITVESVEVIPPGSMVVFSAHGSGPEDFEQADDAVSDLPDWDADTEVAVLTQTTLSVGDTAESIGAITDRFPEALVRNDICYATTNRQSAVMEMAGLVDLVLVIGAVNSSNCNRLREVAEAPGVPSYLINGPEEIEPAWLDGVEKVGITSGASTPEVLVKSVIQALEPEKVTLLSGVEEDVSFTLPKELR